MNFTEWLYKEMSFTEADVPEYFYCLCQVNIQDLESGILRDLEGISGTPEIVRVLGNDLAKGRYSIVLKMPGQDVVKLNKLSRVLYDNPHYLLDKGGSAYSRISGPGYLKELILNTLEILDVSNARNLADQLATQVQPKNSADLTRQLVNALQSRFTFQQVSNAINKAVANHSKDPWGVAPEQEWRIKQEYTRIENQIKKMRFLRIPENTTIIFLQGRGEVIPGAGVKEKIDAKKIKKSSLPRKYKIVYINFVYGKDYVDDVINA